MQEYIFIFSIAFIEELQMHSQTLHKRPSDIYSVYECISTVYTCMNSWKKRLILYWTWSICWHMY